MEALVNLGFQRIRVEDDLFTFRRERTLAICQELDDSGLAVKWRAYARVDTVDPELLSRMRQAGCESSLELRAEARRSYNISAKVSPQSKLAGRWRWLATRVLESWLPSY